MNDQIAIYRRSVRLLKVSGLALASIFLVLVGLSFVGIYSTSGPDLLEIALRSLPTVAGVCWMISAANLCTSTDPIARRCSLMSFAVAIVSLGCFLPEARWMVGGLRNLETLKLALILGSVLTMLMALARVSALVNRTDLTNRAVKTAAAIGTAFGLLIVVECLSMSGLEFIMIIVCGSAFLIGLVSFLTLINQLGAQLAEGIASQEEKLSSVVL